LRTATFSGCLLSTNSLEHPLASIFGVLPVAGRFVRGEPLKEGLGTWRVMVFVEFKPTDSSLVEPLRGVWAALKAAKDGDWRPDTEWIPLFPSAVLVNFSWPQDSVGSEWSAWPRHWNVNMESLIPASRRAMAECERLEPGWDILSLLDAFRTGEYTLNEYERLPHGVDRVSLEVFSYPFGGIGATIALVEAFGSYPLRWSDGSASACSRPLRAPIR
jgi:hypothetical protein